jgi:hypothetical protein
MLCYLGGEVSEVAAFSTAPKRITAFEFDLVVVASLKFANGAVGKLSALLDGDTSICFAIYGPGQVEPGALVDIGHRLRPHQYRCG